MPNAPLIPGTLPGGYCPSSYQQFYNDIFSLGYAAIPASAAYIWVSASQPTDIVTYPIWAPLDGGGAPRYPGIFTYDTAKGGYTAKHSVPAGSSYRTLWVGTEADLWAFDGGDGTNPAVVTPGPYVGAMWQVDTAFAARFPLGPGTLSTGPVANGSTGGEELHKLIIAELPAHNHPTTFFGDLITNPGGTPNLKTQGYPGGIAANTGDTGNDTPHNNMPPYYGVYFIKRTARTHYTAPI